MIEIILFMYSPIGKLELAAGDCLLMVADGPEFVEKHRNNSTFALVSKVPPISCSMSSKPKNVIILIHVVLQF